MDFFFADTKQNNVHEDGRVIFLAHSLQMPYMEDLL